jgi:hypothetical protein
MTHYFKSCCDSSFTFTLTDYTSSLVLGDVWYVVVPNYFSGCSTVVDYLYPESPTYSYLTPGVTLTGSYNNCGECTSAYTCNRITGTNECEIVTIFPMGISCVPNLTGNSISIIVSGGTPPYRILWSSGTLGPTLVGPNPNEPYTVTVTDYNWPNGGPDYTATTTCSLIFPSPTPSPTPTPTPTPIPVVYPNLCLEFNETRTTVLYTFTPTGNIVNGKPTWVSGPLTLQWGDLTRPYWYIFINGNILQNTNPSIPPIGFWTLVGKPGSGIIYTGSCTQPRMTLNLPTISAPNCFKTSTGSLIINPLNAQPPVLYSINGGITTQSSSIFSNLPTGTYNIWVQDGNSIIQTQNATIPNGPASTSYKLVINSTVTPLTSTQSKLIFNVEVRNAITNTIITTLPPGTIITFNLSEINNFMVANNPSYGERSYTVVVTKNGSPVGITPTTSLSTQTVPSTTAGCAAGTLEYSTATTLTYNGITITGSDIISGTVITTISKKSNLACYVKSQDNMSIIQSNISGCNCCGIDGRVLGSPMNINITGGGVASTRFQIIKGSSVTCQAPQGYQIVSPSNLQVYVPIGFTPATASNIYSDINLTQYVTPSTYFFAYNSRIYKVTNNGSPVYIGNDLYDPC